MGIALRVMLRTGGWSCKLKRQIKERIKQRQEHLQNILDDGNGEAGPHWLKEKQTRGYRGLYVRSVNQAHEGADFDFLTAAGPGRDDAMCMV